MTLLYQLLGGVALATAIFFSGVWYEHTNLVAYKAQEKGVTEVQGKIVKAADIKAEGEANVSAKELTDSIQSVHDYYKYNPVVRVQYRTGACTMPGPASDTKSFDAATSSGYASAYSPESTELIAAQLYELQQLLIKDGVIVR
jgi:hypothetical protein